MKKILIFDFETTGKEIPADCKEFITEFGYAMCNANVDILECGSYLINTKIDDNSEASQLTGITTELIGMKSKNFDDFKEHLRTLVQECDYLVAHNGNNFDFKIVENILGVSLQDDKKLIDTRECLKAEIYKDSETRTLKALSRKYNYYNPYSHRAMSDVISLVVVIKNILSNGEMLFSDFLIQRDWYRIVCSYNDKDIAKQCGANWKKILLDSEEITAWIVKLTEEQVLKLSQEHKTLKFLKLPNSFKIIN